jgi:hypothetical protein
MRGRGRICIIGCILLGAPAFGVAAEDRPAVRGEQPPSGNPLWGIPIQQLSATRDRPIFSPSRRPPPPTMVDRPVAVVNPIVQKPAEPERPQLSLLGTIVNGDDGFGIFMDQATKASLRIRIGEAYQGWTLRLLQPGSVTLIRGQQSAVLEFPKPTNDAAAAPEQLIATPAAKKARHPGLTGPTPTLNPSPQSTAVRAQARIFGAFGNSALQQ